MLLYILRHANAAPGHPDEERPLTEKGVRHIHKLCRVLKRKNAVLVDEIWESPLLRARQTAELFCHEMSLAAPRCIVPALRPAEDPILLAKKLLNAHRNVLVVGHNPHLALLLSVLLTGEPDGMGIDFATGALACLEDTRIRPENGSCLLRWLISPRILRMS